MRAIYLPWSRARELEADRISGQMAGGSTAIAALRRLRQEAPIFNAALLDLAEKSVALVRHAEDGAQGLEAEAELVQGTLVFSTARAGELEIEAREAHIRPVGNGRTVAQVSVIGPRELHIYARRGAVLFSYRGESKTIAEGESYQVILDPEEDGSEKKQSRPNAGRPPKAFLLVAGGAGAAAAAVILYEKHEHKQMESPDRP